MFQFVPAVRDRVSLLIFVAGVSGSGKTFSALRIARGLVDGDDSKIAFVDTEAGRGRHYAPGPGEKPSETKFGFQYAEMRPPFSPQAYTEAVDAAEAAKFSVILIDSASHLWEGDGGVQDMHDALLDEQVEAARKNHSGNWAFDEAKTRERLSVGAWKAPKMQHKRFVSRLLQSRAHIILCLRADEKMRMEKVKDDRGRERTVITQAKDLPPNERWSPICEKRLPYEATVSFVLSPDRPGIPIPIKLQEQHRAFVVLDKPLSEDVGRGLAAWARGATPTAPPAAPALSPEEIADLIETGKGRAEGGTEPLQAWFKELTKVEQAAVKPALDTELKPLAKAADTARAEHADQQI